MGHVMPRIYEKVVEIFKLPKTITAAQKESIVESVKIGLERTLEQYPALSGKLEFDRRNGEIGVRKDRDSYAKFEVRYLDGPDGDFPSFIDLEKRHVSATCVILLTVPSKLVQPC